ncbi:allergin-1 isoform X2 [Acomys russatus]|uniref:allergin-1 isoform X2 n=1 Tax=Acomys russatus TaxID=60746 RepID=UPI0021E213D5|nr:allergin-1 isoform X2 [Acomys russatus]
MGDGGSPMGPSLISFKRIRNWLAKLLLWAIFLSTTIQNAVVDCKRVEINELPSPSLNASMTVVSMDQSVSMMCSYKNTSMDVTYSLFLGTRYLDSRRSRGAATFHLKISSANETGPYKCKANVSNLAKYSQEFNFTIAKKESSPSSLLPLLLPMMLLGLLVIILVLVFVIQTKYKKRKALKENESKTAGEVSARGELYANICETQTVCSSEPQPHSEHCASPDVPAPSFCHSHLAKKEPGSDLE